MLQSVKTELASTKIALDAAINKRDRYKKVSEEGGISQERYRETVLAAQKLEKDYDIKLNQVGQQKIAIEQKKQEIEAAKARLKRMEATLNPSQASIEAQRQKIEEEKARGKASVANLRKEENNLKKEVIRLQEQLNRDLKEIEQVEVKFISTITTSN